VTSLVVVFPVFQQTLQYSEISVSLDSEYEDHLSSGLLRHVVSQKLTNVSEVLTASHHQGDEAVSTYETSFNFCKTVWCNIAEDSHLHYSLQFQCKITNKIGSFSYTKFSMEFYSCYHIALLFVCLRMF
jgi:hypothetical protein